jgi:hypothetical protein
MKGGTAMKDVKKQPKNTKAWMMWTWLIGH